MNVKTHVVRLRVIKGPNVREQIAFCAFHYFVLSGNPNEAGYIHVVHWRSGLQAPLVACSKKLSCFFVDFLRGLPREG